MKRKTVIKRKGSRIYHGSQCMPDFACLPRENGIGHSTRNNKKNSITQKYVHENKQRKILGGGVHKVKRATLHFRMKWRTADTRAARAEPRVKAFGAVNDVCVNASGENLT